MFEFAREQKMLTSLSSSVSTLDGFGMNATFNHPSGLSFHSSTLLYISDTNNHRIRYMNLTTGYVGTLAGESLGFADGQGTVARFRFPVGIDVDSRGAVFVADGASYGSVSSNNAVKVISPSGIDFIWSVFAVPDFHLV